MLMCPKNIFKDTIIGESCFITIIGIDVIMNVGRYCGIRLDGSCYANVSMHYLFFCSLWMACETVTVAGVRTPCHKHVGNCNAWMVDGKTTILKGANYFSFISDMLNRTSSQMWGKWYLPMFLFWDGLFTLIYWFFDASGQDLVLPPCYSEIINPCRIPYGVTMVLNVSGGLQMFFGPFFSMFLMIHQYTHHHSPPCHTWICISLHCFGVVACLYPCKIPEGLWWSGLLCNILVPLVFHMLS